MTIYYYCQNQECKKVTPLPESSECCPICQSEDEEVIGQDEFNRLVDAEVFAPDEGE